MGLLFDYIDIVIRCVLSIGILFVFTTIIGKKLISELNFFDFIVGITIGSLAGSLSIDDTISYSHGIIGIIIWGSVPIAVSKFALASLPARRLLDGVPTVLVQNGRIIEKNLKKEKFHTNDLLEELRIKGVFSLDDVEFAVLETSGKLSVQLKSQKQPLTPSDLNIPTTYQGLSANLIIDGQILHEHLRMVNLDENWLRSELKKRNITSLGQVLMASLDSNGNLYIDLKGDAPIPLDVLK